MLKEQTKKKTHISWTFFQYEGHADFQKIKIF